jgi:hypothetical protein
MVLPNSAKSGKFNCNMTIVLRSTEMNLEEKGKRVYSRSQAFVGRHFLAVLFAALMLLQPVIWLVMRSLESTTLFYRCGGHDYPCGVVAQPEPKV